MKREHTTSEIAVNADQTDGLSGKPAKQIQITQGAARILEGGVSQNKFDNMVQKLFEKAKDLKPEETELVARRK